MHIWIQFSPLTQVMDAKPLHSVYLWLHEKQASYRVVLNNYFTFFKIIKAVSVSGRASVGGPAVPAGLQDPHVPSLPLRRFRGDGWKPGTRGARSPGIACSCMVAQGPRTVCLWSQTAAARLLVWPGGPAGLGLRSAGLANSEGQLRFRGGGIDPTTPGKGLRSPQSFPPTF